ncbi:CBS domain-containing protein [Sulfolobus sp. S-194]|uniref:CBS domain-containing protein n=1 Tax=Sulfolobus sp. S-194 TaxID=2512240 RepID=UPI001436E7C7|nr:CBS domain-containing protein [Sulfolobus sp. S-194]QIW23636.1 CBS domain-containing protein [Sulfolobus sp. S-194]
MKAKVSDFMNTAVVTVSLNSTMDEILSILSRESSGRVIVLDNEKPISIITTRSIIAAFSEYSLDLFSLKAKDLMSEDLISVTPDTPVIDAIKIMINNNIGGLPVVENQVIRGLFTEREVINVIANLKFSGIVDSIMSTKIETIPQNSTILDAAKIMTMRGIRRLPIVNEYRMVGIITAADIVKYLEKHKNIGNVLDAGTKNPWTINRYTSIIDAAKIMKEKKIGTLPVIDNSKLVGIVTERDLMYSLLTVELNS